VTRVAPALLAAGLAALFAPAPAAATTCSAPRVIVMVYPPTSAQGVPLNAQVFLHTDYNRAARALKLVDASTGRRVRTRRVLSKRSGLVRLVPRRQLRPRRRYEVRRAGRRIGFFSTGRALRKAAPPQLAGVRVLFSAAGKQSMRRRAGRSARLLVRPSPPSPQVVEVIVELRVPGRRRAERRGAVLLFGAKGFAADRLAARNVCARVLAAPPRGSFLAKVRAWDVVGLASKPLTLRGAIRTASDFRTAGKAKARPNRPGPKSIVPRAAR
jgi:hypothetical protein